MASSSAEQIMPSDIRPYAFLAPISKPPGSMAPGAANGTRSPTAKLTAPQITSRSSAPVVTWQYLIGLRNPVNSSMAVTSATTTPLMSCPTASTDSTSRPAAVSLLATSAGGTDSSTGAYSRSQDSGTRISPPPPVRG